MNIALGESALLLAYSNIVDISAKAHTYKIELARRVFVRFVVRPSFSMAIWGGGLFFLSFLFLTQSKEWSGSYTVVFVTLEGNVLAYDGLRGTSKWSLETGAELVASSLTSNSLKMSAGKTQSMVVPGVDGSIFSLNFQQRGHNSALPTPPKLQRLPVTAQDVVTQPFIVQSSVPPSSSLKAAMDPAMLLGDKTSKVYLLDLDTGKVKHREGECDTNDQDNDGATLLLTRTDFYVRAINTNRGNEIWNASVGKIEVLKTTDTLDGAGTGIDASPKVLYNGHGEVQAFDRTTGTLLWDLHLQEHPASMHLFRDGHLIEEFYSFHSQTQNAAPSSTFENSALMRPTRSTLVDTPALYPQSQLSSPTQWYLGSLTNAWNTVFAIPAASMGAQRNRIDLEQGSVVNSGGADAISSARSNTKLKALATVSGDRAAGFGFGVSRQEYQVVELEEDFTIVEDPDDENAVRMHQNHIEIVPAKLSNYFINQPRRQARLDYDLSYSEDINSIKGERGRSQGAKPNFVQKGRTVSERLSLFQTWRRKKVKEKTPSSMFSIFSGQSTVVLNDGILLSWRSVTIGLTLFITLLLTVAYLWNKRHQSWQDLSDALMTEETEQHLVDPGGAQKSEARIQDGEIDLPSAPTISNAPVTGDHVDSLVQGEDVATSLSHEKSGANRQHKMGSKFWKNVSSSSSSSDSDTGSSDKDSSTRLLTTDLTSAETSESSASNKSAIWTFDPNNMTLVKGDESEPEELPVTLPKLKSALSEELAPMVCADRYLNEFEEIENIGRGASGAVYKVQNRLDRRFYAIKKIQLSTDKSWASRLNKVLREVTILARFDNPNIVRYYQSWLEKVDPDESFQSVYGKDANEDSVMSDSDTYAVSTQRGAGTAKTSYDLILYIQMYYCPQTLGAYVKSNDRKVDLAHTLDIVAQLGQGIAHVHKCGLIHRDLKPDNIFFSVEDDTKKVVKLGDFGLSREVSEELIVESAKGTTDDRNQLFDASQSSVDMKSATAFFLDGKRVSSPRSTSVGRSPLSCMESTLTSQIGTYLYASPEQIAGGAYNSATDMFSIGMILFELCHPPFKTGMERVLVLSNARVGDYAPYWRQFISENPDIGNLVKSLLDTSPENRLSALEVVDICKELKLMISHDENFSSKEELEAQNEIYRALLAKYSPRVTQVKGAEKYEPIARK